ncbi:MAG: hypothetical protein ACLGQH_09760 [Acidobacteriota bacterium]
MFNIREFSRAQLKPRTKALEIPALAPWSGGEAPTIEVRGLTGQELARVREAVEKHRNIAKLLEAAVGGSDKEKITAVREMYGIADGLPEDFAKRIEMLTIGVVSPEMDLETCLKFATAFPVEFYSITGTITELTGMGHVVPGKPAPSTVTAEFGQP